ncbi:aspartate phosphatase [Bacillus velezensis]|nr:aspartate phosphatase [Bacillus velezensis]KAF1279081.1 aspartate phosphatase [Bacillus amyloliquefaciens]AUS18676.1 aspartate phosphatase [Bacillus velezensis]MCO6399253.1 aspartate phosphatase [Bacillus velezensis]NHN23227.1 aspartate phosphatase [Bacillus amyloliquefaciens]
MLEYFLIKFRIFVEIGVYHMSKLASKKVANILNDWYIAIKQQDAESAEKYFEEIKPLLDEMGDEPINWCIDDL